MIPLPQQAPAVALPPAPQNPPVLGDVVHAEYYKRNVEIASETPAPNAPTPDDTARADIYKTQVVLAHSAGTLTQHLTPIKVTLAQTRNMRFNDGTSRPFDIVPFPDGSMPNAQPHNLPPLTTAGAITGLNPGQLNAYCNGYIGVGHGIAVLAARRIAIAQAIGCVVAP